jgi:hypothetical protein
LPVVPVVTSLIGAKHYRLSEFDTAGVGISLDSIRLRAVRIGARLARHNQDSLEIGFDDYRWIGATYSGYERDKTDSAATGNHPFYGWFPLRWDWQARVEPLGASYRVIVNRPVSLAAVPDTHLVAPGEAFLLGARGQRVAGGELFRGSFSLNATNTQVRSFLLERLQFRECRWGTTARSSAMDAWIQRREQRQVGGGPPCQ